MPLFVLWRSGGGGIPCHTVFIRSKGFFSFGEIGNEDRFCNGFAICHQKLKPLPEGKGR